MAELKMKKNSASVPAFINAIEDERKRKDCKELLKIFKEITGEKPKMWGTSIVGYGEYHYTYASGREGDWMLTGFSPRKQDISIYTMCDIAQNKELLKKLGKHKHGKSCLYIKTLDDIDVALLKKLIKESVAFTKKKYA